MQKWEYVYIEWEFQQDPIVEGADIVPPTNPDFSSLWKYFNQKLGEEGWEMVSYNVIDLNQKQTFVFKRPKR